MIIHYLIVAAICLGVATFVAWFASPVPQYQLGWGWTWTVAGIMFAIWVILDSLNWHFLGRVS